MGEFNNDKTTEPEKGKIIYSDGSTGEFEYDPLFRDFRIYERQEDIIGIIFPSGIKIIKTLGFVNCTNLKKIVIPEGVEEIDFLSCAGAPNLEEITLPESLTVIGDMAFLICAKLKSIVIPQNVSKIGARAFDNCLELLSVTLSEGLTHIGDAAFSGCEKLTDITIPASVTEIGGNPFPGCYGIKIKIADENKHFSVIDNNIYSKNKKELVAYTDKEGETNFAVPQEITVIRNSAFSRSKNLANISIHSGVTEIGCLAFSFCSSITSIALPNIPKINNHTFCRCEGLENITVPASVTEIGDAAFLGCKSLKSITLPVSLSSIGNGAFDECESLTDVYFKGNKKKWEQISIDIKNDALKNANIHFKTLFGYTK